VELAVHREAGHRIVFTNGNFDVIHAGHVSYLREAKVLAGDGGVLVVAINADEQVRVQKGAGRPVYPASDRVEILGEMQCVDFVTVFDEPTVDDLLRRIQPDVYVKGGDYKPNEINEYDTARKLGIEVRVLAHRPGLGSRHVIERLRRGVT
jgi:rfaE bifunctional protein nucleotidyltransferase chain/domain